MSKTYLHFKSLYFYVGELVLIALGFVISLSLSFSFSDFTYLYGFLFSLIFVAFYFMINYFSIKLTRPNYAISHREKIFLIVIYVSRIFFLFVPFLIILGLYLNQIFVLNFFGVLIGVLISQLMTYLFIHKMKTKHVSIRKTEQNELI